VTPVRIEVFEAFREIGFPDDEATTAASGLAGRDSDVSALERKADVMKWMPGLILPFQAGIFAKLFAH
jgi:hypothetical protein